MYTVALNELYSAIQNSQNAAGRQTNAAIAAGRAVGAKAAALKNNAEEKLLDAKGMLGFKLINQVNKGDKLGKTLVVLSSLIGRLRLDL